VSFPNHVDEKTIHLGGVLDILYSIKPFMCHHLTNLNFSGLSQFLSLLLKTGKIEVTPLSTLCSHILFFFLTKSDRMGKHPNITGEGTNGMLAYPEDYCTDINSKKIYLSQLLN